MTPRLPRSYLYVPADSSERLPKAAAGAADALIIDLEDAVLPGRKAGARASLRAWLRSQPVAGKQVWVRVNPGDEGRKDLEAIAGAPVDGLVLAKATVSSVSQVARTLDESGQDLRLSPLLESAEAVLDAQWIARLPRVTQLQIGEVDLAVDLGVPAPVSDRAMLFARSQVVLASASAGLEAPIAPVSVEVRDTESFARSTARLAALGFVGRACIHPSQVEVVNRAFTSLDADVESAVGVLEDFEQARARGAGAVLDRNGRLIDEAVIKQARRTLALRA